MNGQSGRAAELASSRLHPRDLVTLGLAALRSRRLRSTLTALGIAIGVAAMIAVLGISESSRADLIATLDRLGTNLLTVRPGQTAFGDATTLPKTAPAMIARIPPVEAVASTAAMSATVRRTDLIPAGETGGISILAADPELFAAIGAELRAGRFLDATTSRLPVVVLGDVAARRLGMDRPGQLVWLGDQWFTVVGILEPVALADELDRAALVGYPYAEAQLGLDGAPGTIYVRANPAAIPDVRGILGPTANPAFHTQARTSTKRTATLSPSAKRSSRPSGRVLVASNGLGVRHDSDQLGDVARRLRGHGVVSAQSPQPGDAEDRRLRR